MRAQEVEVVVNFDAHIVGEMMRTGGAVLAGSGTSHLLCTSEVREHVEACCETGLLLDLRPWQRM